MTDNTPSYPTLNDLACEIGNVQIRWSFLENEMRSQMTDAGLRKGFTKGPTITHWRKYLTQLVSASGASLLNDYMRDLEEIAKGRNLLAHCIHSVSADPWQDGNASVICVDAKGVTHTMSLMLIRELSDAIERIRHETRNVLFRAEVGIWTRS